MLSSHCFRNGREETFPDEQLREFTTSPALQAMLGGVTQA